MVNKKIKIELSQKSLNVIMDFLDGEYPNIESGYLKYRLARAIKELQIQSKVNGA